jgi:hypothetical protein
VIVRDLGDALLLITQPDHARLSGDLMQHAVALETNPRRTSILRAIAEHDNGWAEPDAAPMIDSATGSPLDFVHAPLDVRQNVWPRGIARLAHDPWAAALVAQHAAVVYERYRGDGTWTPFFVDMETMRQTMLDVVDGSLPELLSDYGFVRLGDLLSLVFCNGWTDVQQFDTWRIHLSRAQLTVWPDILGGRTIPFAIDGKEIRQRSFRTDAELRAAVAAASVTTVRGELTGRPIWL